MRRTKKNFIQAQKSFSEKIAYSQKEAGKIYPNTHAHQANPKKSMHGRNAPMHHTPCTTVHNHVQNACQCMIINHSLLQVIFGHFIIKHYDESHTVGITTFCAMQLRSLLQIYMHEAQCCGVSDMLKEVTLLYSCGDRQTWLADSWSHGFR